MKKIILLLIALGAGYYYFVSLSPSPEDGEDDGEYVEYEAEDENTEAQVAAEPEPKREEVAEGAAPPPEEENQASPADEMERAREEDQLADKERADAMVKAIKNFTPEDLVEVQRYYKQMEKRWMSVVKTMVGEEDYADYQAMRKEFQQERKESFKEFHKSMVAQHGKKHVYSPTEYENRVGKKIQNAYFERFRERFGADTYRRYRETLQRFNSEAKRNQDPAKGLLQVFY